MIRPIEIYLNTPPPDPQVPRPVRLSQVTFADLAEPQSQNVAGTLFGGVLLGFIDRAAAFCAMKHAGRPVVTKSFDEVEFNEVGCFSASSTGRRHSAPCSTPGGPS